jgi:hypothetical protein
LVVRCDHSNEFNPSKYVVADNIETLEWLIAAGAVEVVK